MATAEAVPRAPDRHSRRRPFTALMKKLANLKNSSESGFSSNSRNKKNNVQKNNPYPASGRVGQSGRDHLSFHTPPSGRSFSESSLAVSGSSLPESSRGDSQYVSNGNKSTAATISTKADTTHSDTAHSKAGTVNTNGGAISTHGNGGEGSTFSSPAPSVRSLTTTLTTIQSGAPGQLIGGVANQGSHASNTQQNNVQFTHQFPSSPPPSAIPPHVTGQAPSNNPTTYTTATANNLLTDNASVLTLASSSKRRRRNSLDTNASVRALAPSSVFGGSRESLPLSVLSAAVGDASSQLTAANRPGMAAVERASLYSSSGVAPALSSERNSYYANKQVNAGDGASVRSGLASHGHARNDSITGSIGGPSSPLASPRETPVPGGLSRRSSGWGEGEKDDTRDGKNL